MHRRRAVFTAALALPALLCASCGPGDARPPVHPVQGQVLYEGRPAPRALVVFHPLDDDSPTAVRPRGQVGGDGTFTVGTYGAADGAPAGEYAVTVEWWLARASRGGDGSDAPPENRLPKRYGDPRASKLRARVAEGDNRLPAFHLTK